MDTAAPKSQEPASTDAADQHFWNEPLAALMTRLGAAPTGLTSAEAERRLEQYGPNTAVATRRPAAWREFLRRLGNPLILILLMASGLSALAGDVASFVIVAVIVLMSVTLDFVQERHAEHTMEELSRSVAVKADALRDGAVAEVPLDTLVPGDIISLEAGDLVPADCRLIEARDLTANEALLTGEPYPVRKDAADLAGKPADAGSAGNAIFLATSIVTGSARALVCRTGKATALGQIAGKLHERAPASTFELGVSRFGMLMLRLTIFMVLFVLAANVLFDRPLLQSLMFALALAVALTPELLPAIVTVTLARGARRLATRKVVVKQLAAIHNLGSMDVFCVDKTGTLTEAKIELAHHVDPSGAESEPPLTLGYVNSKLSNGVLSPLDRAILDHHEVDIAGWRKVDEVPFDYQRRRVSLLVEHAGERMLIVKGAPESVLALCTRYEVAAGDARPLDAAAAERIGKLCHDLGDQGFRVLAVACRPIDKSRDSASIADESDLTFAGLLAFFDPPKASAGETVRALAELGVELKILTGDNEPVTRHVCSELNIPVTGTLTGAELATLSEPALLARLDRTNIFSRMAPQDKQRVIAALKRRGRSVGYLGDGVNDAPALHAADVGISVDGAAGAAREAASIILLEPDLSVMRDAVLEGRRAVENAVKYILMGTSSNFGNMFSMAGAALFLPILPMQPIQVLLNNLLYDVSELGIPFDNVDEETLQQPVRWDLRLIKRFMLVFGPVSSVFDFLTFFVLLWLFRAGAPEFQTGWFVESLCTQALVVFAIRSRKMLFRSRPHPVLLCLTLGVIVVGAGLPLTPVGAWFGFVMLPVSYYAFVGGAALAYLALVEVIKPYVLRARPPA